MRELGRLIEEGATLAQVVSDLIVHVDRRAGRAHRINELEVRRDASVSLNELTLVFGRWIEALREKLDAQTFQGILPTLRQLAGEPRPGIVGSAQEREAGERARKAVEGMGNNESRS